MAARLDTKLKWRVAAMLADGRYSAPEIAAECQISEKTVDRIKKQPQFQRFIDKTLAETERRILQRGIASRLRRVEAMNDRWNRLRQLIDERAADPAVTQVPGGRTGLLVREVKSVGAGENNTLVEEFAVDTGLLRELRELERQAAQELGQWNPGGAEAAAAAMASNGPPRRVVFEWISSPEKSL